MIAAAALIVARRLPPIGRTKLLEELEETVQSTYRSVVEDAVAALKKPSTTAADGSFEQLILARQDAIDRQLAYLIYKLS